MFTVQCDLSPNISQALSAPPADELEACSRVFLYNNKPSVCVFVRGRMSDWVNNIPSIRETNWAGVTLLELSVGCCH